MDPLNELLWNGNCFMERYLNLLLFCRLRRIPSLLLTKVTLIMYTSSFQDCLILRFENAEGFMFVQDDTILNFWNLVQADKTKLWITSKVSRSWSTVPYDGNKDWYGKQGEMVKTSQLQRPYKQP